MFEGCSCRTNGCIHYRCPCFLRDVGCTSKCKCPATLCVNPCGKKGGEPNAQPGGQPGTSGTPDKAELEAESQIVQPRDTFPPAAKMDFVNNYMACWCKTDGCNDWRCPCFLSNVGCSSKCLCPAPVCVNPIGVRGDEYTTFSAVSGWSDVYKAGESNAEPGGQQGTGGTSDIPDQAELEPEPKRQAVQPESQIGQPRDTSPLVPRTTCSCPDKNCLQGACDCLIMEDLCSSGCNCRGGCKNVLSLGTMNPAAAQGTTPTIASGSSAADAAAPQAAADQAAAQPQPKPLPALEPGSTRKWCHCATSKCQSRDCECVRAGLPCWDRCECKDCNNTKNSEEKLQDRGIKREVPASGSGTSTMTAGAAALAAKESAMGCNCQSECASGCGCVKRNIRCASICKCKPRCGNDDGSRFTTKSKAGPGGQGGTHSSSSAVESTGKRPKHG